MSSFMRLKDRVVFITGASRGIGRACALACAKEGAHIVVAAKTEVAENPRLPGTIHDVAREVTALGQKALALKLDVRDDAASEAAVAKTIEKFGRIDVLINNAGALWWADVLETPVKKFDLIMGINVRAAFVLSRAVLPHMIKQRWGHIVMMSPPVDPGASAHHGAYSVSKFGMTMIAQAIAEEEKEHNVTANAICPTPCSRSSPRSRARARGGRSSMRRSCARRGSPTSASTSACRGRSRRSSPSPRSPRRPSP
jgi:citronellol/citronellal dehydrogenase